MADDIAAQLRHMGHELRAKGSEFAEGALRGADRIEMLQAQADRAGKDAARWQTFTAGPFPICFRGGLFRDAASLNAAVDAARGSD